MENCIVGEQWHERIFDIKIGLCMHKRNSYNRYPLHLQLLNNNLYYFNLQWRIQDFPEGGCANCKGGGANLLFLPTSSKNCMKLKKFGPRGGARVPGTPPWTRQCFFQCFTILLEPQRQIKDFSEEETPSPSWWFLCIFTWLYFLEKTQSN